MVQPQPNPQQTRRRNAMSVLAKASAERIAACARTLDIPSYEVVRQPENGLVMVRGRIGGDGAPFNLGEASVSRAAIRLSSGEVGFGYVLGRDSEKATLIALCDALIQNDALAVEVEQKVIAPLRAEFEAVRATRAAETAATRVDFYTLVRGEG